MVERKRKMLLLVEGGKTDPQVMEFLLKEYRLDVKYEIVSYHTNIYVLYQEMFAGRDADDYDLLQVLKSREQSPERKRLFDEKYTDIFLIFDLDPHDSLYRKEKILRMQAYFCSSSDMGKLYLNYPMVEAFYHMQSFPDPQYFSRCVAMEELRLGLYKQRVNRETRGKDYRKFIQCHEHCDCVILQNLQKLALLLKRSSPQELDVDCYLEEFLQFQVSELERCQSLWVLCTCCLFIWEYNKNLLGESLPQ